DGPCLGADLLQGPRLAHVREPLGADLLLGLLGGIGAAVGGGGGPVQGALPAARAHAAPADRGGPVAGLLRVGGAAVWPDGAHQDLPGGPADRYRAVGPDGGRPALVPLAVLGDPCHEMPPS